MSSRIRFVSSLGVLLGLAALAAWLGVVAANWRVNYLERKGRVGGDLEPAPSASPTGTKHTGGVAALQPLALDRDKLDHLLTSATLATVSFHQPGVQTPVIVQDKAWLERFAALLRKIDGVPALPRLSIADEPAVTLYSKQRKLLNAYWRDDTRFVIYGDDWAVDLEVGQSFRRAFFALCEQQKTPLEKPSPEKIAPPQIDPATLRAAVPPPPVVLPAKNRI